MCGHGLPVWCWDRARVRVLTYEPSLGNHVARFRFRFTAVISAGCSAYIHIPPPTRNGPFSKIMPRGVPPKCSVCVRLAPKMRAVGAGARQGGLVGLPGGYARLFTTP